MTKSKTPSRMPLVVSSGSNNACTDAEMKVLCMNTLMWPRRKRSISPSHMSGNDTRRNNGRSLRLLMEKRFTNNGCVTLSLHLQTLSIIYVLRHSGFEDSLG